MILIEIFSINRVHKETMLKLKNLLSDTNRALRHQRNVLNLLITMLAWMVELFGGLTLVLGSFIFGHGNSIVTLFLQTLSLLFYFVVLPSTFLFNVDEWKEAILESRWYPRLIKVIDSFTSSRSGPNDNQQEAG